MTYLQKEEVIYSRFLETVLDFLNIICHIFLGLYDGYVYFIYISY